MFVFDSPSRRCGGFGGRPRAMRSALLIWRRATCAAAGAGEGVSALRRARPAVVGTARVLVARKAERTARVRTRTKDCIVGW